MIMLHPDLQNAWTVASEGVLRNQSVWFGLYEIPMVAYQGHIIPIVIAVYIMSFIENKLHKIVPEMIDLFVTPLVTSIYNWIFNSYISWTSICFLRKFFIDWSSTNSSITIWDRWVYNWWNICNYSCYRYSSYMYSIIDMGQIANYGYTYWLPIASAANIAQGGATHLQ